MRRDPNHHDETDAPPATARDPVEERLQGFATGIDASSGPAASERLGGDLLPLVADEIGVPSAILVRQSRALRRAAEDLPPSARKALAMIDEQGRRIGEIARAMREIERLSREGAHLARRSVDLVALVDGFVQGRAPAARTSGIRLEARVEGDGGAITVSGDPARITRAVEAVVDGMWGSLQRGAALRITADRNPQGGRISVEGRTGGRGRRRRRTPRLSGAAFAIARAICELHGGSLDIVTDVGSISAWMDFPATQPAGVDAQRRAERLEGKGRLLVVDDDTDAREALSMILGDDYEVLLAADGREALTRAAAERPDVVLMDLYMPRMDGLAALEAMRADPATEDVPVILVSARGDELTRSRSLDLGAVDFLQKPFSGRELKARIERTLRLTRRESELQALARTDALTGLANVRAFRARLDDEVKRARRYHTALSCVMVDMDNLKPINDEYGHAAGDHAIRAVAEVLERELRQTDFAARYGGDEFVLLLPHTSGSEARVFAERVCARLRASPIEIGGRALPLAASFGIAALDDGAGEDPGETLVQRADAALYAAKRAGRGRVAAHPSATPDADPAVPMA